MKLLITGGLGFIGSNFIRQILTNQPATEIVNIDKVGIGANPASLRDLENNPHYQFIKGDITNPQLIHKNITHIDAVVNIAAETHVDRSITDPYSFLLNNTIGTCTILEAIRKHNPKVRLVQVSTDEVYGSAAQGSFTENTPLNPSNPYSASKAAADMFVLSYHKTYKLNASITRCTNNFGPYQTPEKLIPKTILRAQKNLTVPIYGTGANIRDWIHVEDHCTAIETVLTKGKPGEVYNISANNEATNIEIAQKILQTLGKPENLISFVEDRPGHDTRYSLNASKIKTELGWQPKRNFQEALTSTVQWYVQNEKWWSSLATPDMLNSTPWKK
jgi:dTDP-glucose 4,6-dehydratase